MTNCRAQYEACMKAPFASSSVCAEQLVNCERLNSGATPRVRPLEIAVFAVSGLCVWWLITRHSRY